MSMTNNTHLCEQRAVTFSIDPKWRNVQRFHNDDCHCWRCIRYRDGVYVCDRYIKDYVEWCRESNTDIKQHQLDGLAWCLYHEVCESPNANCRGGIVADEMGLGKTFLMLGCMKVNPLPRTLIVVPPILLSQWVTILENKFGVLPFVYNSYHHNREQTTTFTVYSQSFVITTYGILREKNAHKLHSIRWSRVIFDEAHHLRNSNTKDFEGSLLLRSDIRWLLTGTPINNRYSDVEHLCTVLQISDGDLPTHLLRRTKEQVGILMPPLDIETRVVPWSSKKELNIAMQIHTSIEFSDVFVGQETVIEKLTEHRLASLIRARQVCILPSLLKTPISKTIKSDINIDFDLSCLNTSSKLDYILKLIKENKNNGRRKLIFSHYQGEIDYLLDKVRDIGLTCGVIDGRTSKKDANALVTDNAIVTRMEFELVCKSWQNNSYVHDLLKPFVSVDVLIVQIQTACEGLNLQQFNEIYFTSPHWNPAIEDQAIARSHRIGQKKGVKVYRFVMDYMNYYGKPLDRYCMEVQDRKREVAQSIF